MAIINDIFRTLSTMTMVFAFFDLSENSEIFDGRFTVLAAAGILIVIMILIVVALYNGKKTEAELIETKIQLESAAFKKNNHYITTLDKEYLRSINIDMLNLIKSPLIYCLLYGYCSRLSNFNLIVDGEIKIDSTVISEADWFIILAGLINNAVKYLNACEEGTICLHISKKAKQYFIEVENSYRGDIDFTKIYESGCSVSLLFINEILDEYMDIFYQTRIKQGEGVFIQALLLKAV